MENYQHQALPTAKALVKILAATSLVLAPLLSLIGWGISHQSLSSLVEFNLLHQAKNAAAQLTPQSAPALVFRYYLLPHYFLYASMPIYIVAGLTIMYHTYKKAPFTAFLGAILSIIGGVYFVGVLGAYLSAPVGSVQLTGILKISFVLCLLVFVGNILLGISLYQNTLTPKWTPVLFILGNSLILIFPGIENWMALGSLCMLLAMCKLNYNLLRKLNFISDK